jgi:WD40 repeat protein
LFEARTGKMIKRISGLPDVAISLAFSREGRYLAAGLHETNGLRVFDRDREWAEAFRDTDYGGGIYGLTFAADGRLATASQDGKVRLYDRNFKPAVAPSKTPSEPTGSPSAPTAPRWRSATMMRRPPLRRPFAGPAAATEPRRLGKGQPDASHVVAGRQDPLRGRNI